LTASWDTDGTPASNGSEVTSSAVPAPGARTASTRLRATIHSRHSSSAATNSAWIRSASSRKPIDLTASSELVLFQQSDDPRHLGLPGE
jgi:hypothetical protein